MGKVTWEGKEVRKLSVRQSRAAGLRPMGRAGRLLRPGLRYRPVKPALQARVACA